MTSISVQMVNSTALMVVKNLMVVEVRRADGSLAERHLGSSAEQIAAEHHAGRCGAFCGYCYQEAMTWAAAKLK